MVLGKMCRQRILFCTLVDTFLFRFLFARRLAHQLTLAPVKTSKKCSQPTLTYTHMSTVFARCFAVTNDTPCSVWCGKRVRCGGAAVRWRCFDQRLSTAIHRHVDQRRRCSTCSSGPTAPLQCVNDMPSDVTLSASYERKK